MSPEKILGILEGKRSSVTIAFSGSVLTLLLAVGFGLWNILALIPVMAGAVALFASWPIARGSAEGVSRVRWAALAAVALTSTVWVFGPFLVVSV